MTEKPKPNPLLSILQRLEKQFNQQSPLELAKEAEELSDLRYYNLADFQRRMTKAFSPLLYGQKPEDEQLIPFLFALLNPLDEKRYHLSKEIMSLQISHLLDCLENKKNPFLTGEKYSTFILPTYLVLRGLKEKSSYWLLSFFSKFTPAQRKEIIQLTQELKNKIIDNLVFWDINLEKQPKEKVKELLSIGLNLEEISKFYEPPKLPHQEINTTIEIEGTVKIKSEEEPSFSDENIKAGVFLTESEKEFLFSNRILLKYTYFDPKTGEIKIKGGNKNLNKLISRLKKDDPLFEKISNLLEKEDIPYFVFIYSISPFPVDDIDKETLIKKVSLFKDFLKTFNDPEIDYQLKDEVNADSDNLSSFAHFNRLLALKLYQKHHQTDQVSDKELIDFLKQPINTSILFSLRRLFLFKLLAENYRETNKLKLHANLDYVLKQLDSFFVFFNYLSKNKKIENKKIGFFNYLSKNKKISLNKYVIDLSEKNILGLLLSSFIEQYLSETNPPFIVDDNLVKLPPLDKELTEEDLKSEKPIILNLRGSFYVAKSGLLLPLNFNITSDKKIHISFPFKPNSGTDKIGDEITIGFYQL
jgi:hypothetical protein